MKLIIPVALLLFAFVFTRCSQKQLVEAENAYRGQQYCEGADKFKVAYTKLSSKGEKAKRLKGEMAYKTGESYRLSMSYKDANEWYQRAIDLDYASINPLVYYYNGEMLQMMGQIDKALKNFEEYKKLVPNDDKGDAAVQSCKSFAEMKEDKSKHVIENQVTLNSKEYDMAPMFGDSKDTKLYFSSTRSGGFSETKDPRTCESYMDLWFTSIDAKGNVTEPKLVIGEGINTEDNEGTVCFDGRKKLMFFTRCPNEKKKNLGCDIWVSEVKGKDEWGTPKKIELKTNDSITVGHPCVSDDGKYLIFVSDMPGGSGGKDLWYSTYDKKNDKWAAPINLGKEINTSGNELFPTFAKNGDLLFATDGMVGLGGLDIYKAKKIGNEYKWEDPKNLGAPINSEADDYALIESSNIKGYFTSDRKGVNGTKPDIYTYDLPPNLFDLKVIVSEKGNKSVKIADVVVVVKGSDNSTWEGKTAKDGSIMWDKKPTGERFIAQDVTYNISIAKDGFYEYKKATSVSTIGAVDHQNFVIDMELLPIKPIRLPEVRYPYGQYTLLVDSTINSKDSLNFVFDLLNEYPGMVLELSSHTDARGKDAANQILSENRAKECVKYLVEEKGIDPNRLKPVGQGERTPATWKDPVTGEVVTLTEAYINQFKEKDKVKFELLHQLNRRTEGKVLTLEYVPVAPGTSPAPTTPVTPGK
ncbi:MAG: OmpA family protein [Flavobacteriia bacterium]|nr:OmpA family protein [Flavobacteriia bacterium]